MWILLIEDEPRIRAFIARGLGAEGLSVDERDDGRLGLRRALEKQYDLVILDLGLPSMDGLSVLEALSRERPELPVLVLSARSDLRTRLAAFSLGACDYL
jgi:two-component system copper resistance phosphate regulon response regulator CusR